MTSFELSQSRITRTVESLQAIGLQAQVNVELCKSNYSPYAYLATKWCPMLFQHFCYQATVPYLDLKIW